jgi:hypothetical protein
VITDSPIEEDFQVAESPKKQLDSPKKTGMSLPLSFSLLVFVNCVETLDLTLESDSHSNIDEEDTLSMEEDEKVKFFSEAELV